MDPVEADLPTVADHVHDRHQQVRQRQRIDKGEKDHYEIERTHDADVPYGGAIYMAPARSAQGPDRRKNPPDVERRMNEQLRTDLQKIKDRLQTLQVRL